MFRTMIPPQRDQRALFNIVVDGRALPARAGETVAAVLLNAGVVPFRRTPVSGQPRAPLCMMGVCFECLLEVDGVQNVQSCMVQVREGMQVRLPEGARRAGEPA